jgi:cytochrome c
MKKMSIVICIAFLAYACGNSNQNSSDQSAASGTSTPQTEAAAPAPATASTDSDNPDYKGGSGVWGQVPMTPHPNLSVADAEQMVKYILLLKKS